MRNSFNGSPSSKNKIYGANLTRYASLFGVCMLASVPAWAEPSPALDRASISVGAFHAEPTFKAGVDTPYGRVETPARDHSDVTIPRVRADFLLFDSQGISFDYYRYDRSYNLGVAGGSTINGQPVTGSAAFNSDIKIDLARLSYKWWLGQRQQRIRHRLGWSLLSRGYLRQYPRHGLHTWSNIYRWRIGPLHR
jgi:hypothetical protein